MTDLEFTDDNHLEHIEAAVNATGSGTVETTYVEPGDDGGPGATYTRYDFDGGGRFETIEYDRDSDGRIEAVGYDRDGDGRPETVLRAGDSVSDDVRRIPEP